MERTVIRGLRAAGVLLAALESLSLIWKYLSLSSTSIAILQAVSLKGKGIVSTSNNFVLMIRSFSGDRWRASTIALPSIKMFVSPLEFDFYLILDKESQLDQKWGQCLRDNEAGDLSLLGMDIVFESQPKRAAELFHATAFANLGNPQYNKAGYDRQQWSTFYMDKHARPDHEIISIIDSDGCFFSFYTKENIVASDGRIMLRAGGQQSHYQMDREALKLPTPYEFMYPDRMPMSFWKSTFVNVRQFIAKQWNVSNFDNAFQEFSKGRYSQFNIIATYAITMESDRYVLIPHDDSEHTGGTVSVGSNKCRSEDVWRGCCASFNTECPIDAAQLYESIQRFHTYENAWLHNDTLGKLHYENVHRQVDALLHKNISIYQRMTNACQSYVLNGKKLVLASQCLMGDEDLMEYSLSPAGKV